MDQVYYPKHMTKFWMVLILIIAILGVIILISQRNVLRIVFIGIPGIISAIYVILIAFRLRIIKTETGIRMECHGVTKPRELTWEEIDRVVDDCWMSMHHFDLIPKTRGKKRITISGYIINNRELMAEVLQRVPHAIVEESVKRYVEKGKV